MNQSRSSNEAIDPEVITESQHLDFTLEPIAELALEEYNYSGVVVHTNENHRLFNRLSIPLTGNRFLFYYQGTAKAGSETPPRSTLSASTMSGSSSLIFLR